MLHGQLSAVATEAIGTHSAALPMCTEMSSPLVFNARTKPSAHRVQMQWVLEESEVTRAQLAGSGQGVHAPPLPTVPAAHAFVQHAPTAAPVAA